MTIIISNIFRVSLLMTVLFAVFLDSNCPGGKEETGSATTPTPATKANTSPPPSTAKMKLFIPSYLSENEFSDNNGGKPGEWDKLIEKLAPGDVVIINPNSGPVYDPNDPENNRQGQARYKLIVDKIKGLFFDKAEKVVVLGYVHSLDSETKVRPFEAMKKEIDLYDSVSKLKDIFFDQFVTDQKIDKDMLYKRYKEICDYVRDPKRGGRTTLNPGTVLEQTRFAEITDWIVVFESSYNDKPNPDDPEHPKIGYKNMNEWKWSSDPNQQYHDKIVHLILDTKKDDWNAAVTKARDTKAAYVWVTEFVGGDEWNRLPEYWGKEIDEIRK